MIGYLRMTGMTKRPEAPKKQPVVTNAAVATTKSKWTSAKRYKIFGTALLLIAFGMQMYQVSMKEREAAQEAAAELDARKHTQALGYENLYFNIKAATGQDDPANLQGAAMERAVGRASMIVTSDLSSDVKVSRSNELMLAASQVHDLDSFNTFMNSLQQNISATNQATLDSLMEAGRWAKILWWVYICLYVIGSASVLWSQYLE